MERQLDELKYRVRSEITPELSTLTQQNKSVSQQFHKVRTGQ